jgi:hypothetical protein
LYCFLLSHSYKLTFIFFSLSYLNRWTWTWRKKEKGAYNDTLHDKIRTCSNFRNSSPSNQVRSIPFVTINKTNFFTQSNQRKWTKKVNFVLMNFNRYVFSMNAPIMVNLEGETDPLEIAMKELRQRRIPLIIRRY